MQKGLDEPPTTSSPSPAAFLDAFRVAAGSASSILCLTVSPRYSSSYDSAATAAAEAREAGLDAEVVPLDTESAAGGQGLVVTEALRTAHEGLGVQEVLGAARNVVHRVTLLAYLDTLYYLWKGGRVPKVAHWGTSLLQIKPVFELRRGEVRTLGRPRTARRAVERMVHVMRRSPGTGPVHATVMHGAAGEAAEQLRRRVESEFSCRELFTSEFSPVMGAHTGPGLLGIAFWREP
jgi:DegV family protein with EDD domain